MVTGKHVSRLSGYAPALPTPFDRNGSVDGSALELLCDRQIQEGATALVVCGTTGEAPTLSRVEHAKIVRIAVDVAKGRVPVIAGAGSNATRQAIELARDAEAAGADAVLSVTPYYNKPMQAGMYAHFRAIGDSIGLPIFLYDVPSRTVCGVADETVARLAQCPKFIGLKDATADLTRPLRLRSLLGEDFRLLSGDDATALAFIAQGGNGCVSVTSNVAPGLCRAMYLASKQGQAARAQQLAAVAARLTSVLFRESNPVPVKYALSVMKMIAPAVRLPLVELQSETKAEIDLVLAQICDGYAGYMIDPAVGFGRHVPSLLRLQPKRKFSVVP
ncbi:MAG TPA: 4-hydroxy-tetrahydrodipicolinate synthase [Xanthobacteraceae bacterium]